MITSVSKYELWNALFLSPDEDKTDNIKDIQAELNNKMGKVGRVWIDIREEEY